MEKFKEHSNAAKSGNKRKGLTRVLAAAMCMLMMFAVFTGCGMAAAEDHQEGVTDPKPNKLLHVYDDGYGLGTAEGAAPEGPTVEGSVFETLSLKATVDYGFDPTQKGFVFIRDWAIMLLKAAFNGDYGVIATEGAKDYFATNGGGDESNFTLDPKEILLKTNTITMEALTDSYTGPFGDVLAALIGVASSVLVAIWATQFIQQVVQERFTMESALKGFMQLIIGLLVITNAGELVAAFAAFGDGLMGMIKANAPAEVFTGFKSQLEGYMSTGIFAASIGLRIISWNIPIGTIWFDLSPVLVIIMIIIPVITQIICAYKIVSIMVMRMLELVVRVVLTPIPLAFSAHNGFSQDTIRYFRGVVACAAQPMLMMMGVAMTETIAATVMTILGGGSGTDPVAAADLKGLAGIVGMALTYTVLSAYIGQTGQLAKEIISS